jgi:7-alpha-hydroxysteroid dehydrogenase
MLENFRIDDKVAIISAAGRGIGAATARAFAEAGANVVIGARTEAQLHEVAADVAKLGRRAEVVTGNLMKREGMEQLVARALSAFGKIDIVVNNAGGSGTGAFLDTSERAFNKAFEWNVTTAFNLSQLATPHILEQGGGAIINIASAAGRFADRGFAAYGTAKAALCHLTRNLAAELAPKIRVNAVAPGATATGALESVLDDELRQKMVEGTPLRRLGRVEDIAAAVLYLASPAGSYVTGRVLEVDGGLQRSNLDTGIPDLS